MNIKNLLPLPVVTLAALLCAPASGFAQSTASFVVPGGTVTSAGTVVPGTGVVSTGSLVLGSTGAYTKGASSLVLGPGTALFTTVVVIDGNMANGAAPATLRTTAATVTLTGVNTYTGGTYVDAGALITGAANLPANQAVTLSNGSGLFFTVPTDATFGGVISGSGSVIKLGSGALTISGRSTYTGGTTVNAGTLVVSTASLPAAQNVSVASGSTLAFNQATDGTFSGRITGSGTIQKRGVGELTLTNITTSAVDLQVGALYFNGGIGTTTVAAGAFLGGTGTISGNLGNNGTVSPGYSPGRIAVTGNFTQSSTGVLVIQLASGTSFDQLAMTGTAALAGSLRVDVLDGYNPIGQSFTFLTATGGVSGTFSGVSGSATVTNNPTMKATLIYAPNSVTFALVQASFASFALTPNQQAVATAAQASAELNAAVVAVADPAQYPAMFNALSPQGYQVWSDFAFAHATALTDRLHRPDNAIAGHDDYYFDASQRRGRARSDLDVGSSTFTSTAGLVGVDHVYNDNYTIGGFFNYSETVAGLGRPGSRTSVKDKMVGLRGTYQRGPWFAVGTYGYGWDRYNSTRPVVFSGASVTANSETNGHNWLTDLTAGRHFARGAMTLSPYAGVLVAGWRANGFTETGAGVYSNRLGNQSARSLRTQVGVEGQLNWEFGSVMLQPRARAAWLSEFSNGARSMQAAIDSVPYAVTTRGPQRDSALFSAGLNMVLNPRALLYADYTAQSSGIVKYLSDWRLGATVRF